jgi:hypothetical protein
MQKLAVYGVVATLLLAMLSNVYTVPVNAAVGDVVATLNLNNIIDAQKVFCSIGVAFDGKDLYVTACRDSNIYKIDTSGNLISKFDVVAAGSPVLPNALAFDAKRNGIWFGGQSCTKDGMPIQFWDFNTNTVTTKFTIPFNLTNPATGERFLSFCFNDGLAYNENNPANDTDDEIWFSDDVDRNLGLFRPDGTLVNGFDASAIDLSLSPQSGLAVGGGNLYMANNGGGSVFRVNTSTMTLVDQFFSGDERQEDMECDPVTFAPKQVMWLRSTPQGNPNNNLLRALEIEPGTCGVGGVPPPPPSKELVIKKLVSINQDGIQIDEVIVPNLKNAKVVEVTLVDPSKNVYVYHGIPKTLPAFIPWSDPDWSPQFKFIPGEWKLLIEIIAHYEDPVTKEIKQVDQKIIIRFNVDNKGIIIIPPKHKSIDMEKVISINPHPATLNGKIDIGIGEAVTNAQGIYVAEVTIAKPSGTVISYENIPIDITNAPAVIPFPAAGWNALGPNPTIALDEIGMYELDIEILAFYDDGTQEIKNINQKLWVSFNVIPESILGVIGLIGAALGTVVAYRYRSHANSKSRLE